MKLLRDTIRLIIRRPFIILFLGLVTLACSVIDSYNPVFPILAGLGSVTGGDIFENIISFLQFLVDPDIIPTLVLFVLCLSIAAAVLTGLVFSGYFYTVNNILTGKKRFKGEFIMGLKKHFLRISLISFRVLFFGLILAIFMLVASVPAMIITNAARTSKPELLAAAVLVDMLTAGVLFFGLMFFRTYMFFWYPAAMNYGKKSFSAGKQVVDAHFWNIAKRFIAFDIIFIAFQFLFAGIDNSTVLFAVRWIFTTVFLLFFTVYLFTAFKAYTAQ